MIERQKISSFNPFKSTWFRCPVCGSNDFTELHPYGGVWCSKCNAEFNIRATCDGLNKIAIDCHVSDVHKGYEKLRADQYGTVLWVGEKDLSWLVIKNRNLIGSVSFEGDKTIFNK